MNYSNTTIIIPTLNEERNITKMIDTLVKLYKDVTIIVADDGSKDKTQDIVLEKNKKNKNIVLLDRTNKIVKGLTASVYEAILQTKTKFFVVIDGDLQHPPEKIKEIVKSLEKGNKIVIGEREKVLVKWPWHRKLISKGAIFLGKIRLIGKGILTKDVMSGFFGGNTKFVKIIIKDKENKFEMSGYKILFDILKLLPKKTEIGSVKYIFGLRSEGESKIGKKHIVLYFKSLFK